jgi:hypothetical protein
MKLLIKLLGPVITPLQNKAVTRVKEAVVTATFTGLTALVSAKAVVALGLTDIVDPSAVSLALGAAAAAFANDVFSELRAGGTAALQKLLVNKYGLPLRVDDWFGEKTKAAAEAIIQPVKD